jgi:hypothetical protein
MLRFQFFGAKKETGNYLKIKSLKKNWKFSLKILNINQTI